jgi:hypothetical protein
MVDDQKPFAPQMNNNSKLTDALNYSQSSGRTHTHTHTHTRTHTHAATELVSGRGACAQRQPHANDSRSQTHPADRLNQHAPTRTRVHRASTCLQPAGTVQAARTHTVGHNDGVVEDGFVVTMWSFCLECIVVERHFSPSERAQKVLRPLLANHDDFRPARHALVADRFN